MTPAEFMADRIRRDLRHKQRELTDHMALCRISTNAKLVREHEAVIRRKEKSLASLTAKLLCAHEIEQKPLRVHGFTKVAYKCRLCKAYVLIDAAKTKGTS